MKVCIICKINKEFNCFYAHSKMKDGFSGKCKECTKKQALDRYTLKKEDVNWMEQEKERGRIKYKKYLYKNDPQVHEKAVRKNRQKYPEKGNARSMVNRKIKTEKGTHNHHWCYQKEFYLDVIILSINQHALLHRFLIYEPKLKMYKNKNTNEILDTKEKHLLLLNSISS